MRLLVPRGWEATPRTWTSFPGVPDSLLVLGPPDPLTALPHWLRRWLPVRSEPGARIGITASRLDPRPSDGQYSVTVIIAEPPRVANRRVFERHETVTQAAYMVQWDYYRTDRAAFDRTAQAIYGSLHVSR